MSDGRDEEREVLVREFEEARAAGDAEREKKALEAIKNYDRYRGID